MRLAKEFSNTAQRFAEQLALCEGDKRWTYGEALEGVKARTRAWPSVLTSNAVVLALPKSANLVLWQLAVNACKGVFVPMDPALPASRLHTMLELVQPAWQVTPPDTSPVGEGWSIYATLPEGWVWQRHQGKCYDQRVSHIYFSSGSTGQPKAILLPDAPVISVVRQQAETMGVSEASRFGWLLQAAFDASLSDCYQALLSGAALHICTIPLTQRKTVRDWLRDNSITHTDIPPSMLPFLNPEDFPALEGVIFGGELARESVVKQWAAAGIRMFNAYGPTEATICSSFKEVDASWRSTNIGQALSGVAYAVRDERGVSLVAPGVAGELVILGEHLAFGYDQAEMSAKRFRESGWGRGYWTGDAVSVDAQGDLHFLGRIDRQIKRNGVLVCPEELERAAYEAGCAEARVELDEERLVLHFSGAIAEFDIQQSVQQALPRAFWPNRLVRWVALPKNVNGKLAYGPTATA
jgi:non-ribosomal peptide synthetase component F